ncbi:MAG: hypothetical protein R3181_12035 [Rubricoccaceae bacterium]|nr:hypothetical protein [Rubricoccaceae bacterium]
MMRSLVVLLPVLLAGCAGGGRSSIPAETFSNTVWQEVCPGTTPETALLRFLPDGTFAYSTGGLAPGDFQHDGDDRWGIVGRVLVVTWDDDGRTTQYRASRDEPGIYLGTSSDACGAMARLEPVE